MLAVRVAVLHCDVTPVYGSFTRQMFRNLLDAEPSMSNSKLIEIHDFDAQAQAYPNWDEVEACIITGSNASAYSSEDWICRLTSEIKDLVVRARDGRIRLLGVCFGHQILAMAMGGEVKRHVDGLFFGERSLLVSAHAQLGLGWDQPRMKILCSHSDVVSKLPPGAQPFGISSHCGVEGMVLGQNILSVQGHPEFSTPSGLESMRALAKHFVNEGTATEEVAQSAVASAEAGLADAGPFRDALIAFLCDGMKSGPLFGTASSMQPIIGFGSLLSEASARSSFPNLNNFRLARLRGFRRVMQHPASIFFQRGIASLETREMASLSVEACEDGADDGGRGFLVAAFDIPANELPEFFEREEEFFIVTAPIHELDGSVRERGLLCLASTDDEYKAKHGEAAFHDRYVRYGLDSIWSWRGPILPCRVYLRHCVLAAQKAGQDVADDFLDTTLLRGANPLLLLFLCFPPRACVNLCRAVAPHVCMKELSVGISYERDKSFQGL